VTTAEPPVAILGFQHGLPGTGPRLAELNTELGRKLSVPGLLRYQVLVHSARPERICVYWLWRRGADRDELWAAPTGELTDFWDLSRPLWAADPEVGRYHWRPSADRDLCPPDAAVRLTPLASHEEPGEAEATADGTPWLHGLDSAASVSCEQAPREARDEHWIPVWQSTIIRRS
jgi:hypothetical protein